MSLKISELKASIVIDCGELDTQLDELHKTLTSYNGVFGKIGMKLKAWSGEIKFRRVLSACDQVAKDCAEDLQRKAYLQTPEDTHALEDSMYIERIGTGTSVGYEVGYDKDNAQNIRDKYGIIQHEVTSFHHPKKGKAKFLEDPYNANIMRYKDRIRSEIQGALR